MKPSLTVMFFVSIICTVTPVSMHAAHATDNAPPRKARPIHGQRRYTHSTREDSGWFILPIDQQLAWLEKNCTQYNDRILLSVMQRTQKLLNISDAKQYDQPIIERLQVIQQKAGQTYTELEDALAQEDAGTPLDLELQKLPIIEPARAGRA